MPEVSKESEAVLIALFPDTELTTNALKKEIGVGHHTTAKKRAQPLISKGLVQEEERGEKGNFRRLYSLTDEGRKIAKDITADKAAEYEEKSEELWQKVIDYEEAEGED